MESETSGISPLSKSAEIRRSSPLGKKPTSQPASPKDERKPRFQKRLSQGSLPTQPFSKRKLSRSPSPGSSPSSSPELSRSPSGKSSRSPSPESSRSRTGKSSRSPSFPRSPEKEKSLSPRSTTTTSKPLSPRSTTTTSKPLSPRSTTTTSKPLSPREEPKSYFAKVPESQQVSVELIMSLLSDPGKAKKTTVKTSAPQKLKSERAKSSSLVKSNLPEPEEESEVLEIEVYEKKKMLLVERTIGLKPRDPKKRRIVRTIGLKPRDPREDQNTSRTPLSKKTDSKPPSTAKNPVRRPPLKLKNK